MDQLIFYIYLAVHLLLILYLLIIMVRLWPLLLYAKQALPFVPITPAAAKLLAAQPELIHPHTIVDLGCGTGTLLASVAKVRPDAALFGIDIKPNLIRLANWRSAFWRNRPTLMVGDMFAYDLSQVDAIVGWWVPAFTEKMLAKLKAECKSGCVIALYMFSLPEDPEFSYRQVKKGKIKLHIYQRL